MTSARASVRIGRVAQGRVALALDDLAATVWRRRRPGDDQDAILIVTAIPSASSISIVVREMTTRSTAARKVASSSLGRTAGESVDAPWPLAFG